VNPRFKEGALRFAERRKREDDAPRLRDEVPRLKTLRLEVEERHGAATVGESRHVRHILVDRAPALFLLHCGDSACKDGGHDVTRQLLDGLKRGQQELTVEDTCRGEVGSTTCERIVKVVARATYGT
jgi:hypothetical protein